MIVTNAKSSPLEKEIDWENDAGWALESNSWTSPRQTPRGKKDEMYQAQKSRRDAEQEMLLLQNRIKTLMTSKEKSKQKMEIVRKQEAHGQRMRSLRNHYVQQRQLKQEQDKQQQERCATLAKEREQRKLNIARQKAVIEQRRRDQATKEKRIAKEHLAYLKQVKDYELQVKTAKKNQIKSDAERLRIKREEQKRSHEASLQKRRKEKLLKEKHKKKEIERQLELLRATESALAAELEHTQQAERDLLDHYHRATKR